jgi:hypothetical protein
MMKRLVSNRLNEVTIKVRSLPETGTHEYGDRIDELISDLRDVKLTLRSGKNRYKYRKESGNLQRAIEALRYLRRQSDRLIKDENEKTDRLVERLSQFNLGGSTPIEQCDVSGTLDALGIKNTEVQKALSTALTDFVPYYLCSATKSVANTYTSIFTKSISLFNQIIDDIFDSDVLDVRLVNLTKFGYGSDLNRFELINLDNVFESSRYPTRTGAYATDVRRKNLDTKMKNIMLINPSGYNIVESIFSFLLDDKLRNSLRFSSQIGELSTVLRNELTKAEREGSDDTINKSRINSDFKNAAVEIIKKYYEQSFGPGSFPTVSARR